MPPALDDALTELDGVERGFVLGALLVGAGDDPAFANSLPAASRERCAAALSAIAALSRAERVRLTGLLAHEARAAVPAGIASVHPDHLRAALENESPALVHRLQAAWDETVPPPLRAAIADWLISPPEFEDHASPSPADPELLLDVQRSLFAGLAEVPAPWRDAVPRRYSRRITLLEPAELLSLATAGGDDGARALGAHLAREEAHSLDTAAQLTAVAQRLPLTLAWVLLEGAGA